jgi:hypothetical protein
MTLRTSLLWKLLVILAAVAMATAGLTGGAAARADPAPAVPTLRAQSSDSGPAVHHDRSRTLASMAALAGPPAPASAAPVPLLPLPHPKSTPVDPVVQHQQGPTPAVATTSNFDGIGSVTGYLVGAVPPDPNAAVGTTQVVEIVNTALAVYSKTGATIMAATSTNTLWTSFGGSCAGTDDSDPTVSFDRIADQWVIQQLANAHSTTGPYFDCVAVSATGDATGSYFRYSFQSANLLDYPKIAVWPSAYFVTFNIFAAGPGSYIDAEACAMDRASMLAGVQATQQCFTTSSTYSGLLAADLDGSAQPPAGADETLVALGATNTTLATWKFHADFANPGNSTFTGPTALTVAAYTLPCGGTGGTCVPQGGTSQQLDTLGDRLMYRAAYRNFGDHQAIVVDDSVTAGSSAGMRWYELRVDSAGAVSVFQQGTYAPDSTYRWMGSVAQDRAGDIALGYSQSSSSTFPSIRFTGRAPGDPLGTMTQAETTVFTGGGSQTGTAGDRWGDYTSMAIDPVDDCTFWYTDQYEPANGVDNWQTRLASFQLPGCSTTQGFTLYSSPSSGDIATPGSATSTTVAVTEAGTAQTVSLSASGLPAGATAMFSPASLAAAGTSTLTLNTSASTPDGTYPITIAGTGTTGTETITYTLTVGPIPSDFSVSVSPIGAGNKTGRSVPATVSTALVQGLPQTIAFGVTGLPSGTTASFNPTSVATGGSSTLTISLGHQAKPGNYTLTITGTSPTNTHSVQFLLIVEQ